MHSHPSQSLPLTAVPIVEGEVSPFAGQTVTLSKQEYIELQWQVNYWSTQHARAVKREEKLKEILKQKEAIIRDLKQRLYGKKSEKGAGKPDVDPNAPPTQKSKRPRGQQKGTAGHGRTPHPDLPVIDEVILLNETACTKCGKEYSSLPDEEASIIEIEVRAHVRRIKRQKCAKNCSCLPGSKIMTAPIPPKLLLKSPYGVSVWEQVLLNKFLYGLPVNRILNSLTSLGLTIAPGTIAGGLKKLLPLFKPIYESFRELQMTENKFHNDETRWEVYEQVEGKEGHRWYLWVTRSESVIYYAMDPTRSAKVPIKHFAELLTKLIIVICDRYSAYKKLARINLAIILAFCWAHVRRDFLDLARSYPHLKDWGLDWVEEIDKLYHLNKERLQVWDKALPLTEQSSLFQEKHAQLGMALNNMRERCEKLLAADEMAKGNKEKTPERLERAQRKVLVSLKKHWKGLNVFYEHPEVSMDNNAAEQSIRNPVLGRNSYYGSGSLWSAELAAMMFSIFQTLLLWNLNPRTWLNLYLKACANNAGKAPQNLNEFLPWMMSDDRLQQLSKPLKEDSS
jgi:transposase